MGWFERLRTTVAPRAPALTVVSFDAVDLRGVGQYSVEVHGESHHVSALVEMLGDAALNPPRGRYERVRVQANVVLCPEPENRFDPNAVMVLSRENGAQVGYMTRDDAARYSPVLRDLLDVHRCLGSCHAMLVGGHHDGQWMIGVYMDLEEPELALLAPPDENE